MILGDYDYPSDYVMTFPDFLLATSLVTYVLGMALALIVSIVDTYIDWGAYKDYRDNLSLKHLAPEKARETLHSLKIIPAKTLFWPYFFARMLVRMARELAASSTGLLRDAKREE